MPEQAVNINIIRLPHAEGLELPAYETAGAAGFDLRAAIAEEKSLTLTPMQRLLVPTGFCLALPEGYEMQIRPRSGLAYKNGITLLNSPGTIDSDYRGEIQILLINLSQENFTISRGMRIAQALIAPVVRAKLQLTAKLSDTIRGTGGFGSTGQK